MSSLTPKNAVTLPGSGLWRALAHPYTGTNQIFESMKRKPELCWCPRVDWEFPFPGNTKFACSCFVLSMMKLFKKGIKMSEKPGFGLKNVLSLEESSSSLNGMSKDRLGGGMGFNSTAIPGEADRGKVSSVSLPCPKPQQSEIFAVFPLGKVLFSSINKLTCASCCRRMGLRQRALQYLFINKI